MENNKISQKEQLLILSNRKNLSISGTNKIISLKPDLIQLDTIFGGLLIIGNNLELITLDNTSTKAEISGEINALKFTEIKNKEPLLRKIFKWFFQHKTNWFAF